MKCRVCGCNANFKVYKVKELHFGFRDIFEYLYCSSCGCLFISDIPENLSKYYPDNYYSFKLPQKNFLKEILIKIRNSYSLHRNNFNLLGLFLVKLKNHDLSIRAVGEIKNKISKKLKDIRILDIGCGEGAFLHELHKLGFRNLVGIDPYIKQSKEMTNIKILKIDLLNFDAHFKYDLVTFNHSFEHLIENPFEILSKVFSILENKGYCIIRMPTTSSFAWDHYRENWFQIDAPRHTIIYSLRGIEILAEKTGFQIEKIYYDSTEFQFIGSEQYKKDIPLLSDRSYMINPNNSIFSANDVKKFKKLAELLNANLRGDQFTIILKKRRNDS